ncbi:NifU-like protein, putative [Brugia malayi]|uniref:NifU-like protein, putative n=1 Tax=Brugia malayi TaxID=6279 RepID=A0A4E9F1R5_BRUMA|nr:NifU-like protein, putative [Brugia malayi]VIO90693.1 NifU-like protein, putative [Brugia malayi]
MQALPIAVVLPLPLPLHILPLLYVVFCLKLVVAQQGLRSLVVGEKILDHYENPKNVGSLDKNDPSVGTGLIGAPSCGNVIELQINVNDKDVIEDEKFKLLVVVLLVPQTLY